MLLRCLRFPEICRTTVWNLRSSSTDGVGWLIPSAQTIRVRRVVLKFASPAVVIQTYLFFSALKQDVNARTKGKGCGLSERSSAKPLRNSILLKPSIDKTNPLLVLYPIQQNFSSVFYENCYIFFKQNFMHFVYILSFCCTSYT